MTDDENQDNLATFNRAHEDPMFRPREEVEELGPPIFQDYKLLDKDTVPESNRIVGRDKEIKAVAMELRRIVDYEPPNSVLIFGKTGTGKSLVAKHVNQRAIRSANSYDIPTIGVYIDCAQHNTNMQAARKITRSVNQELDKPRRIPFKGLGAGDYYEHLWELLDEHYQATIIILDELDKLKDDDDVLLQLIRAGESDKISTYVAVIGISNKIDYQLSERVDSSFQGEEFIFDPYNDAQLTAILENRRDAFRDGVLKNDVIECVANLAASEHGDARKAIDLLRCAGELAEKKNAEYVTNEIVAEARPQAEMERITELLRGSPDHVKLIMYAFAKYARDDPDAWYQTGDIYDQYARVAKDVEENPLSRHRVWDLLNEQEFLNILNRRKIGHGPEQGTRNEYMIIKEPDVVWKTMVESDARLRKLEGGVS